MNLENVSTKHLNELERLVTELQATMRKAGLHGEPIVASLYELEQQIGQARRARYDAANPEYSGY
jgi:hypothetical protein